MSRQQKRDESRDLLSEILELREKIERKDEEVKRKDEEIALLRKRVYSSAEEEDSGDLPPSKVAKKVEYSTTFRQNKISIIPSTFFLELFRSLISLSEDVTVEEKCQEAAKSFVRSEAWMFSEHHLKDMFASALGNILPSHLYCRIEAKFSKNGKDGKADIAIMFGGRAFLVIELKSSCGAGNCSTQGHYTAQYAVVNESAFPLIVIAIGQEMLVRVFGVCFVDLGDNRKIASAEVFPSFSLDSRACEGDVAKLFAWLVNGFPLLESFDDSPTKVSLPLPFQSTTAGRVEFVAHVRNSTFQAVSGNGSEIVVRFMKPDSHYGEEVQKFCSDEQFAPRFVGSEVLRYHNLGWSSVKVIMMEFVRCSPIEEFAKKSPSAAKTKVLKSLEEILLKMRSNNMVHGDLHPRNVLVRPDCTPLLVDFEFSGKTGQQFYSPHIQTSEVWHSKVQLGKDRCPLHPSHDKFLFDEVIAPILKEDWL